MRISPHSFRLIFRKIVQFRTDCSFIQHASNPASLSHLPGNRCSKPIRLISASGCCLFPVLCFSIYFVFPYIWKNIWKKDAASVWDGDGLIFPESGNYREITWCRYSCRCGFFELGFAMVRKNYLAHPFRIQTICCFLFWNLRFFWDFAYTIALQWFFEPIAWLRFHEALGLIAFCIGLSYNFDWFFWKTRQVLPAFSYLFRSYCI